MPIRVRQYSRRTRANKKALLPLAVAFHPGPTAWRPAAPLWENLGRWRCDSCRWPTANHVMIQIAGCDAVEMVSPAFEAAVIGVDVLNVNGGTHPGRPAQSHAAAQLDIFVNECPIRRRIFGGAQWRRLPGSR